MREIEEIARDWSRATREINARLVSRISEGPGQGVGRCSIRRLIGHNDRDFCYAPSSPDLLHDRAMYFALSRSHTRPCSRSKRLFREDSPSEILLVGGPR